MHVGDRAIRNVVLLRLDEIVEIVMLELPLRKLLEHPHLLSLIFEQLVSYFIIMNGVNEIVNVLLVLKSFILCLGWRCPCILCVIHLLIIK
jgi:hypothetical protein